MKSSIDSLELRKAFGGFLTGVTVVTTIDGQGDPRGFTANSFSSVSLDPPLLLVCLDRRAKSFSAFMETAFFAVNVLAEDQRDLSNVFASKQDDKFAGVAWSRVEGSPFLDGSMVSFGCAIHDRVEAGDHVILLGRVLDFAYRPATPLGFHSGNYVDFSLERRAAEAREADYVSIGAILEHDGKILMVREGDLLCLPRGDRLGELQHEADSLFGLLDRLGVTATVNFIYSLFHDAEGRFHIYYTGTLEAAPVPENPDVVLAPLDALPWDALSEHAQHLLRRYMDERESDQLGIFVGTTGSNTVKGIGPDIRQVG